jgi:hypothetical protein
MRCEQNPDKPDAKSQYQRQTLSLRRPTAARGDIACANQCTEADLDAPKAHIVAGRLDLAAACVKVVRDGADPTAALYRQLQVGRSAPRS